MSTYKWDQQWVDRRTLIAGDSREEMSSSMTRNASGLFLGVILSCLSLAALPTAIAQPQGGMQRQEDK